MFLIKKLWVDVLTNRNAYGYNPFGVVSTEEEAEAICSLNRVKREDYIWPLSYVQVKGCTTKTVPMFIYEKIEDISGVDPEFIKSARL
jgi:hypothetical protein